MKRIIVVALTVIGMMFLYGNVQAGQVYNSTNGHYYERIDNQMTWSEAKTYCQSKGGYLATITSQDENDFIYQFIYQNSDDIYWLGGTDENTEGVWKWVTGETWSYTNWILGEPNNSGNEDHLTLGRYKDDRWNDSQIADISFPVVGFICEWDTGNTCFTQSDLDTKYQEGYQAGLNASISGACTQTELDTQYQAGKDYCKNNPSACGISPGSSSSIIINTDLSFTIPSATYNNPLTGNMDLSLDFNFFEDQNGNLLWKLGDVTIK